MHTHLAGTQLSPSAVHTIIELGYGTVVNASALGELLRLEKSSISRLLKKLEMGGLVKVDAEPSDRRVRNLGLTPQGTALLRQIEEYARRQLRSALSRITNDELRTVEDGLIAFASSLSTNETAPFVPDFGLDIREGYQTGLIAAVTDMHASFYSKNYGFGAMFERKVATEISEFMGRIDRPVNTTISAYRGDRLLGSVSLDGEDLGNSTAHLRWFIVSPSAQGLGLGKQLIEKATAFVDENGFRQTRLWTFQGLDAARYLYESVGFLLVDEKPGSQWGTQVVEQEFTRQNPS
jgi:DNA-binding MarR family transcriptional regulator/GNAT superfamily N-acetyltransferase